MSRATYHLWLKPSGKVSATLARTIQYLANELGGPVFDPHVTLLADLIGTEREHIQRTRIAAQQLRPFRIILGEPAYLNQYFQSLFMRVEQAPSLMNAHALARQIFEKPLAPFMSHLSLAYGVYQESRKIAIINKLSRGVRTSFEVTALFLIKAESNDPQDWYEITNCPFTC
jgi:2'-5' RNA ligase